MDLATAIEHYCGEIYVGWSCGDAYEDLQWPDDASLPKPTLYQLEQLYQQAAAAKQEKLNDARRAEAYRVEADPLYFKWQRGSATKEEWLAKIAEIKERF